jgi:tetratricopeptide (TPR) repeat protein
MSHLIHDIRRRPAIFCLFALISCAAISPAAWSADKPKAPELSRVIAKEMTAAQKAMQAQQWSEGLKNLEAAETKSPLTAYDKLKINEFKANCYVRLNNLKAAQTAYEAALATGAFPADELPKTYRVLFQLAANNQQSTKAIEYGKQMSDAGAATDNDLLIMAQLYYQQKDCKNSGVWGDKAIAAFKKAGEQPKEVLYQLKLQCASDANETPAMIASLYDLVRLTNKTSYWNNLIRLERQDERDDHNLLMIYRVMYDTNSMQADTDYMEMAQLLGDAALPGEAQMVLEKLMSTAGVLKDEHKERTTRLLNAMKTRADADKKGLPALDAEAAKNPAGQLDVKLGEVYYGAGDYQGASTAINRGLGKKQIKQEDEAYVYLGRAQTALKNYPEAKKAFVGLKGVTNMSPRVLKLWELYADKLG